MYFWITFLPIWIRYCIINIVFCWFFDYRPMLHSQSAQDIISWNAIYYFVLKNIIIFLILIYKIKEMLNYSLLKYVDNSYWIVRTRVHDNQLNWIPPFTISYMYDVWPAVFSSKDGDSIRNNIIDHNVLT